MYQPLQLISDYARNGAELREKFFSQCAEALNRASFETALAIATGAKLLICGNGGSAADAQHIAAEFINRFLLDRPGLPAIALTTDTSAITAIANDSSYERIFARQIEALGKKGDVLLAISTSGTSANILAALLEAKSRNMITIGLSGANSSRMRSLCDFMLAVPSDCTPLVQEMHLAGEHLFCQICDYYLFENTDAISEAIDKRSQNAFI